MSRRRAAAVAVLLLAFATLGCSGGPSGECEVTAEGNRYRSNESTETDQLPGSPEIGRTYSAASGCVPGDSNIDD